MPVIVEAATAIAMADLMLIDRGIHGDKGIADFGNSPDAID